jgi:hypothetical protein
MPRSAPSASAVRICSWQALSPSETAIISVATPFLFQTHGFFDRDFAEGVDRHLHVVEIDAGPSPLARTLTL